MWRTLWRLLGIWPYIKIIDCLQLRDNQTPPFELQDLIRNRFHSLMHLGSNQLGFSTSPPEYIVIIFQIRPTVKESIIRCNTIVKIWFVWMLWCTTYNSSPLTHLTITRTEVSRVCGFSGINLSINHPHFIICIVIDRQVNPCTLGLSQCKIWKDTLSPTKRFLVQ